MKKKSAELHHLEGTYRPDRHEKGYNQETLKKIPTPPNEGRLSEHAEFLFYSYSNLLLNEGRLTAEAIYFIEDLAYWEDLRSNLETKLAGEDPVLRYYDEEGKIKHSQPSGTFVTLKQATAEIDRLRLRLHIIPREKIITKQNSYDQQKRKTW